MYQFVSRYFNKPIEPDAYQRLDQDSKAALARNEAAIASVSEGLIDSALSIDPRDLLRFYLRDLNLAIPSRAMLALGPNDNFELWTLEMRFIATGNALIKRLSYSMDDLVSKNWSELFVRDPFSEKRILEAAQQLMAGAPLVADVTDHHMVAERDGARVSAMVQVKLVAIAKDQATGAPKAFLAITNIKDQAAI